MSRAYGQQLHEWKEEFWQAGDALAPVTQGWSAVRAPHRTGKEKSSRTGGVNSAPALVGLGARVQCESGVRHKVARAGLAVKCSVCR